MALILCGFDSLSSLSEINESYVAQMENHINEKHMEQIQTFNCCYSQYYKGLTVFRFLPGHVALILGIPKYVVSYKNAHRTSTLELNGKYSFILEEMIRTAESNLYKDPNHAVYSDAIKYFSTYIFLQCGRSCYEMLRKNLPLPSVETICK